MPDDYLEDDYDPEPVYLDDSADTSSDDDDDGTPVLEDAPSRIVAMSFCEPRSWTRVLSS